MYGKIILKIHSTKKVSQHIPSAFLMSTISSFKIHRKEAWCIRDVKVARKNFVNPSRTCNGDN